MNVDTERVVMRAALEKWGERSQLDMLYEEVGELLTAIGHFQRGRCDRDAVASEIADVQIMLAQMAEIIGPEMVAAFRAQKIHRLAGRLGMDPPVGVSTTVPDETIALYLAPTDAKDLADLWAVGDLDTLAECVEAQYGLGREGGDSARFARCKEDLARALDVRSDDWSCPMSAESAISWLARQTPDGVWHQGHTFNPWSGCYIKSPGCRECYAKNLPPSMRRGAVWGKNASRVLAPDSYLAQVRTWNRAAAKLGIRMPVFCASTADIFERHAVAAENDDLNRQRAKVWALVGETPWLDWLFLTKEPENILGMIPAEWVANGCPANVWMGCTVENQEAADTRIPHLLRVPAVVRFLSIEPMIGPVDLRLIPMEGCGLLGCEGTEYDALTGSDRCAHGYWGGSRPARIHWVLCGGESGRGTNVRPMHPQWARSLRDQCVAANVAFHFKQHGEWLADNQRTFPIGAGTDHPAPTWGLVGPDGHRVVLNAGARIPEQSPAWADGEQGVTRVGKHASGRTLDGRTWDELPEAPHV